VQFLLYVGIGGIAALANLALFLGLLSAGLSVLLAAPIAFIFAAFVNYLLCLLLLFRHKARWNTAGELIVYWCVVGAVCLLDLGTTKILLLSGLGPGMAKLFASTVALVFNFLGRRFFVFPEPSVGEWKPQENSRIE
jgi:dolichol-phosphate mannosyltransferase